MGGGSLQLSAIGKENNYLTIDPQISMFKAVYKLHNNFAMQSIRVSFLDNDSLSYLDDTRLKLKIPKNAELINTMYLDIKLPRIFNDNTSNKRLVWIDNLANNIVKNARILIGGEVIEEYDSNMMYIYNENFVNNSKYELYNKLTKKQKTTTHDIVYSSRSQTYTEDGNTYINKFYNNVPSIDNERLVIPLPFWFHRNIGLSLPIHKLEYDDIMIELVLRPIRELCLIEEKSNALVFNNASDIDNITVDNNLANNVFHYRLTKPDTNPNTVYSFFENNRWIMEPNLDINYIFLSESDKRLFLDTRLEYIVEPVIRTSFDNIDGRVSLKTNLYHQVKELYFIPQRTDIKDRNQWLNYTNNDSTTHDNYQDFQTRFYGLAYNHYLAQAVPRTNNPIYYLGAFTTNSDNTDLVITEGNLEGTRCFQKKDIENFIGLWNYRSLHDIPYININNHKFYEQDIIEDIEIFFDQVERVSKQSKQYYECVQPYITSLNKNIPGVYLYSFSLNPKEYQPSGKCNFSHLKEIILNTTLKDTSQIETSNTYKYNLNVYSKYYNILSINSGTGRLLFRN